MTVLDTLVTAHHIQVETQYGEGKEQRAPWEYHSCKWGSKLHSHLGTKLCENRSMSWINLNVFVKFMKHVTVLS